MKEIVVIRNLAKHLEKVEVSSKIIVTVPDIDICAARDFFGVLFVLKNGYILAFH